MAFYAPFAAPLLREPPEPSGGAELQITRIAGGLAGRGLKVAQIVYPDPALPAAGDGVTIIQRGPSRVGAPGGPLREQRAVAQALRRARAGAYVHRSAGVELFLTTTWCRLARRPLLYSSSATSDFTGQFLSHRARDWRLYRIGLSLARIVVVQTEEQVGLAAPHVASERLRRIPSLVEPAEPRSGAEFFLWAGRASKAKNPRPFLELARSVPEARFVMVVGGLESDEHAVSATELAAEARDIANLEFVGGLPHAEVMRLMARAAAVVNTSTKEGMPNVFLEAWARAVPVVSLHVDPDALLARRGLGLLAGGSVPRLADHVRRLLRDPEHGSELGHRGRAHVGTVHDPGRVLDAWQEVLAAAGR